MNAEDRRRPPRRRGIPTAPTRVIRVFIVTPPDAEIPAEELAEQALDRCQERIGYQFGDRGLLRAALTHASGATHRLQSNERLEFLGDAILALVVCELLYQRFSEYLEGDLTKVKSVVVSRQTCATLSRGLGLDEFLILGKGMATARKLPTSLMAGVFESIVAAIYLDGGYKPASDFIVAQVGSVIEAAISASHAGNYKSLLQQISQREFNSTPVYQLLDEKGPDHNKCFKMSARIGSRQYPPAWGRNKKEAEQRAALNALTQLNGDPAPVESE